MLMRQFAIHLRGNLFKILSMSFIRMCVCALSHFWLFVTPKDCSPPLSMEFFRQEYWRGLPFPPPGDLSDPGIEPTSPTLPRGFLLLASAVAHSWWPLGLQYPRLPWEAHRVWIKINCQENTKGNTNHYAFLLVLLSWGEEVLSRVIKS